MHQETSKQSDSCKFSLCLNPKIALKLNSLFLILIQWSLDEPQILGVATMEVMGIDFIAT